MQGVLDITGFLVGFKIDPYENIVLYRDQCTRHILSNYPELGKITYSRVTPKNWKQWLKQQAKKYGETFSLSPMNQTAR